MAADNDYEDRPGGQKTKLSDDRIVAIIDYGIAQSVGFSESKLSKERARVQEFYDAERPFRQHKGDSSYVSDDVYQGVENMGAQLLDVFSTNGRPVRFEEVRPGDDADAEVRTDYVSDVIFRQNPGYSIFRDTINEGLLARAGICKVWWEDKTKTVYRDLSEMGHEEIISWLQQNESAKVVEKDIDEDTGEVKRFQVSYEQDVSQVKIRQLPGEEWGISPMAESIETADLVFHRHEMTVSDLLKAGFKKSVVDDLQSNDRLWMAMEPEKIARFMPTDDLIGTKVLEDGQNARRVVMVYECYLELDMDGTDKSQLYKVTKVSNTILSKEPVDRKPFIAFVPLPRPNAFWGHNFAKKLEHIQSAKTYLTRGVVDHTLVTNRPKVLVGIGALANPRELMENRLGGIVNVKDPSKILPMPQLPMNSYVFQTLQLLDQQKESSTGISQLQQGLNGDAVSKQNSADMIHELITVAQLRQKIVARNFAEGFLTKLYTEVYNLLMENGTAKEDVKLGGQWAHVDPTQWPECTSMDVSFALGYGEAEREAQKWATAGQLLEKDPLLAQWYTPTEHYKVATKALEASGIKGLLRPLAQPAQPPQNPLQQAEIAMKNADAQAKSAQAQATLANIQLQQTQENNKLQIELAKIELEKMKISSQHTQGMASAQADMAAAMNQPVDNTANADMEKLAIERMKVEGDLRLKQDTLAHQVTVDSVEMGLQMKALEQAKLTANAQPKG